MGALLLALVGTLFTAAAYLRILPRHRIIVVPDNYYGEVTVAHNEEKGKEFNSLPFNTGTTKIIIPSDGNLIISDWDEFGGMSSQYFVREDGTILDGTHPWTSRPQKVKTGGTIGRTPKSDEDFLLSAAREDGTVSYSRFTILNPHTHESNQSELSIPLAPSSLTP